MDPRLQRAAESGSIDELYAVINENPFILDNIDAVPFVNTPLHVAAASGNLDFAMELLTLKPSFARKLDTNGYSPLHLAVNNDQIDVVTRMLWLDHSLASVKGRNGITPFLLLVLKGNADLVVECLRTSPDCIENVSINRQNALHLAVDNDRFDVLQILTGWIQRMSPKNAYQIEISVLNKKDFNYNTVLHLAAIKNDHRAIRLLLGCPMMLPNELNSDGLTFLDILRNKGHNTVGRNLDLEQVFLLAGCKEAASMPKSKKMTDVLKSPIISMTRCCTHMTRLRSSASHEARGVFLIVCALIITTTYQTALQPPGGVHQSGDKDPGSVVMKQTFFIILWLSNTIGFCCAVFYTFCLIPLGSLFTKWYYWIGTSLCISYALAMAVISPHPLVFFLATILLFTLYLLFSFVYVLLAI